MLTLYVVMVSFSANSDFSPAEPKPNILEAEEEISSADCT
jgi:hypothetical protein